MSHQVFNHVAPHSVLRGATSYPVEQQRAAAAMVFGVTLTRARRLDEPKAASMEDLLREILIQSQQRYWLRFWPRG